MKYLISFLLITFFFVGCSSKKEVEIKISTKKDIDTISKKEQIIYNSIYEDINPFIDDSIIEDTIIKDTKDVMKLAFIYPSNIVAKYAKSSINTVLAYFDYKGIKYKLKIYDTLSEDEMNIQKAFNSAKEEGYTNIIALFTPRVTEFLQIIDTNGLKVYLPLTNKQNIRNYNNNFIYGAISYKDQVKKLFEFSNTNNVMFYQNSFLTNNIKNIYQSVFPNNRLSLEIKKEENSYEEIIDDLRIENSTLFLNTSIIKTSIILSQLRAYEIYPKVILSTQLNYNHKVFSLTQVRDRLNFILANSIDKVDDTLKDTISFYGADVIYNWVDYSTLVGVNYLYDQNSSGLITTRIEENQVMYKPKLFITTSYGFLEIK